MALTKTGQILTKEATLGTYLWNSAKQIGRGVDLFGKGLTRLSRSPVVTGPTKALGNATDKAVRASGAVGSAIYKHPKTMLPATALAAYGAYKLPSEINKNLYHVDPNMHVTDMRNNVGVPVFHNYVPTPFNQIKYRNAQVKRMYENQKLITKGL